MIFKCAVLIWLGSMLPLLAADTNGVKVLAKGAFSGIQEAKQIVVTNQTQWAELWKEHTVRKEPKSAPPEVNFDKETVVFVSLGQKRTGGYGIGIEDIRRAKDKTEVLLKVRQPKPGGFQIQAITAPFVIAAIPKTDGKVEIKVE